MGSRVWIQKSFQGGWSIDKKVGIKYSAAYIQAMDFRKNPSQMSVLPQPTREDTGVVTDLVQNEIMASNGNIYALGSTGTFYRRSVNAQWSLEANIDTVGCYGMDYRLDTDTIYLCGTKTVSSYYPVSNSPAMNPGYYASSVATSNTETLNGITINPNQSTGTQTYTVPTTTNESSSNRRLFQSDIEPCNKIAVFIVAVGTGDWTMTLHDGLNNVLATKTVTNANLVANTFNAFEFTSATNGQVRLYVTPNARTYHVHLTSTVADGTVRTAINSDFGSCDLQVYADRLVVTNNGMHPMARFLQYEIIGNANYLSVWEPLTEADPPNSEWLRHRLSFPMEYECCGVAATNEFAVMAFEKTSTNNASQPQEGLIAFWDGTSATYNYFIRIPEGSPYALHEYKNIIYYYAGGSWWAVSSPASQPYKIKTMPNTDTELSSLFNLSGESASGNPFTATLIDNFNGTSSTPDTTKWDTFNANVSQANGLLNLNSTLAAGSTGISSDAVYDLTGSVMQIEIISVGNQALTSWEVYPLMAQLDSSNLLFWLVTGGNIQTYKKVANVSTQLSTATFSSTNHRYVRIRELSGTTYFDYSSDGLVWTNASSLANPFAVTGLLQIVFADTFNVEASTTVAQLDDFNVIAPSSPIKVYPYSATVRRDIHLMGWPSLAYSPDVNFGVYTWGAVDKNMPEAFGYNYVISTGAQNYDATNNLAIGMVKNFGDILHISWRDSDSGGYGVDVVTNSSTPAEFATWESIILDNGIISKLKTANYIKVTTTELPEDAYFYIKYSINRGEWVYSDPIFSTDLINGTARFDVTSPSRYQEIQLGIDVYSGSTSPVFTSIMLMFQSNVEEDDY